ncbi:MAG: transglutaminase-like domain-containing protein [Sulfobacillus sp.]
MTRQRYWHALALMILLVFLFQPSASAKTQTQSNTVSPDAITTLPAYYSFTKTVTISNQSAASALDVNAHVVLLAPQTAYSTVTLINASVSPSSTHYDQYGNLIGVYTWPELKPGQTETIVLNYLATSSEVTYKLPLNYPPYNKKSAIYRFYTSPTLEYSEGVNTDAPALVALDQQITSPSQNPYQKADAIFEWIVHNIRYNYSLQASGSSLATLQTHLGICSDFADLYTALLRTDHIPARLVGGYVTNNGAGQGGFHQWVEFYLPSVGWVVADPTWGQFGYFANLEDNWHIPLYDGIRQDISVHWYYSTAELSAAQIAQMNKQIKIGYNYAFHTDQTPPAKPVAKRPILAVKPAPKTHSAHPLPQWASLWVAFRHWVLQLVHNIERWLGIAPPPTPHHNYWPHINES